MRQLVAGDTVENVPIDGASMVHAQRKSRDGGLPFLSGHVVLVAGETARRTPVVLKLYWPAFGGPYAVLAPDKGCAIKDCGSLSLRNCSVRVVSTSGATGNCFRIACSEGTALTFQVASKEELTSWVQALTLVMSSSSSSSSSSSRRNRKPLQPLSAQFNHMSPMAGRRRWKMSSVPMPTLEEEECAKE